ncbi:MAG: hypothetical protein ACLUD0_19670 [Eubacterium ramulus]
MKLKNSVSDFMTAVLTAGLLASPAMASEVTDAASVQNGTVTVQAAATENGTAGTGTSDDYSGEKSKTPEKMMQRTEPIRAREKKIPARMTVKEIPAKTIRAKMTAKRMKLLPV